MNLSAPAISRPIATILLTAAVAIAGGIAFVMLPVSPLPEIDSPTISVNASLPGASPDVMAAAVATPLEREFGHIAGVSEMTSRSATGSTSISLQFDLSRDINAAARDVQAAISAARTYLPTNLPSNPAYRKVNSADAPIAIIGVTSKSYSRAAMYDAASTILAQTLSQIPGVGQVTVGGSSLPAVRVEINPRQLEHYGVRLSDVATFLRNQNAHTPTGSIADGQTTSYIKVNDQLATANDYKPLVVSSRNGAGIRLDDVATVVDANENVRSGGYVNGSESVSVNVFKQPGANVIETVDRIKAALPALSAAIPAAQKITLVLDRTTTIRASLHEVERTLLLSIVLVILVVFVFLRDWRATIVPGVAVPVSLIGTFAAMYLLGYSLDNLSLMALTISTGFVIDDAIVVMENITRHLELGMGRLAAAYAGAAEIGFTVLSITMSLLAVFIPILMMGGIVGRLFREFAVTLSVAILISMMLSLTTTPMLCSLLLKPHRHGERHGRLYLAIEAGFDGLRRGYERSLAWVLRDHAPLVLLLLLVTMGLNVLYLTRITKGFFPQQDTGAITGGLQGTQDSSFEKMNAALQRAVAIVRADPAVENVVGFTGGQGATNSGFMYIALKPLEDRKISASDVVNRLRPKLLVIREAQTFLQAAQDLRVGGRQSNSQYQFTLQADSTSDLKTYVPLLAREMAKLPQLADVSSDLQTGGLEAYLTYDRATAARLGLTPSDIDSALNYNFSQAQVSTIYKTLNQYHVVLEAQPTFTGSPDALRSTYVESAAGSVPLVAISTLPAADRTALGQSLWSVSLVDGVVQSGAGWFARRGNQGHRRARGAAAHSDQCARRLFRHGGAVSGVARFGAGTNRDSDLRGLHRPRRPLRELRAPDHDPDDAAVGVAGGGDHTGPVRRRARRHLADRHHPADRHRQEERHHDDRFRAAGGARAGAAERRGDPAGLRPALPADPDDDGGGIFRRRAAGVSWRHWLGAAASTRSYHPGRSTRQPGPHALHDAGRLPDARSPARPVQRPPACAALPARGGITMTRHCVAPLLVAAAVVTGCNVGPTYRRPELPEPAPAQYKENQQGSPEAQSNGWRPANPQDALIRGKWWEVFGDPELNGLEEQVIVNNQTIKQAFENYMSALAVIDGARATLFPTVSVGASANASGSNGASSATTVTGTGGTGATPSSTAVVSSGTRHTFSLPVSASWEPDLFGKVRNTIDANVSAAQVSAATLANETLSQQATLAETYFELRGQDALQALFTQTVSDYQESLRLTQTLYRTGIDSEQDVAQAETALRTAEANATAVERTRAQFEHAIALLTGHAAGSFSVPVRPLDTTPPDIPTGVPSQLLERRPDIAGAERTMAEANARIGVGKAAYYPTSR